MVSAIDVPHRFADEYAVAHVAHHQLDTPTRPASVRPPVAGGLEVSERSGAEIVEYPHLEALLEQGIDEMGAHEASAAGDESQTHSRPLKA
jgi:hypothetical protein